MTLKATVSDENYHRGHGGTQRKAQVGNASGKASYKYRIIHKRDYA